MAIPILMYHHVAAVAGVARRWRSLYVTPSAFAWQMGLLHRLGYRGLSMSDAMPYLRGERAGRVAVVTLDDGYLDNFENALPVLQRFGFTATCYVVSGSIGRHNTWDADRLGREKPMMNTAQVLAWRDGGMEVGAHTRSHPYLTRCDVPQLREEIVSCKAELETLLDAPVLQFCYPYGDVDDRVLEVVREAGYLAATTSRRGRAMPGADLWRLPRVPMAPRHILRSWRRVR
jgi:peptidoglycan/xylan/chitin deacetylase (PgdA/CDA1 family)